MISALKEGEMKVEQVIEENKGKEFDGKYNEEHRSDQSFTFVIKGGMMEVKDNKIMVLAE